MCGYKKGKVAGILVQQGDKPDPKEKTDDAASVAALLKFTAAVRDAKLMTKYDKAAVDKIVTDIEGAVDFLKTKNDKKESKTANDKSFSDVVAQFEKLQKDDTTNKAAWEAQITKIKAAKQKTEPSSSPVVLIILG